MSGLSGPQAPRGPCPSALLLLLLFGPASVLAISFHLPVNSRKCLREEIHKDLLVTGAYEITDQSGGAGGLRTHLKVRQWAARAGKPVGADEGRLRMGRGGERAGGRRPGGRPGLLAALRARCGDRPSPPPLGVGGAGPGTLARTARPRGRRPLRGSAFGILNCGLSPQEVLGCCV